MAQSQPDADMEASVSRELAGTPYEASSLKKLTGGTANFIFRATLKQPLADGTTEVAIKHGEGFVAQMPSFALTTARCQIEEESLRLLSDLPHVTSVPAYSVGTPKLYHFNPTTNTQVQEYLPNAISVKEYILQRCSAPADSSLQAQYVQLGEALGRWLRAFHQWAELPEQQAVRKTFGENKTMQGLKHMINYQRLVQKAGERPDVLQDIRETLQEICDATAAELADESKLHVIHGDFWTGNVLLPNAPIDLDSQTPIRVIDWEMAQLGIRPLDLGQMIAELWELKLYRDLDAGPWVIRGFAAGYGPLDTDTAFRSILHVGAHLICFGASTPGWGTAEQNEEILRIGKDVLIKAWKKDRDAFNEHALEDCYLKFINLKVNQRLASLHKDTRTSLAPVARRYLAGLSFGPSSSVLTCALDSITKHHAGKKSNSGFEAVVVHVDTDLSTSASYSGDASAPESPAQQLLARYRERFPDVSFECVHLSQALAVRTIDWSALPIPSDTTAQDRLRGLFDALPSASSRADILRQLVRHLLLHLALEKGCQALLLGHSTTALAALTLAEVAGGRGFSVPWQVNDGQFPLRTYGDMEDGNTVPDQYPIYYPLREVFLEELKTYLAIIPSVAELIPADATAAASVVSHKDLSIEEVMNRYFQGVEGAYTGIIANVVRTAGKLDRASSQGSCRLCGVTLDEHGDSTWAGEMGDDEGENSGLCYGCKRSING